MIVRCTPSAITYRSKDSLQNKAKSCPKKDSFRLIGVKAAYAFAYPAARRNSRCRVAAEYRAGTMSIGANPPLQILQEL